MSNDQTTSAPADNGGALTTAAVVSACALVALVLAGVTVLTLLNRPVDNVLILVGSVVVPTVAALLATRKLDNAKSILHDVSVKVNGRLDGALSAIAALEEQVRQAGHTPVTSPTIIPLARHSAENPPIAIIPPINPAVLSKDDTANG